MVEGGVEGASGCFSQPTSTKDTARVSSASSLIICFALFPIAPLCLRQIGIAFRNLLNDLTLPSTNLEAEVRGAHSGIATSERGRSPVRSVRRYGRLNIPACRRRNEPLRPRTGRALRSSTKMRPGQGHRVTLAFQPASGEVSRPRGSRSGMLPYRPNRNVGVTDNLAHGPRSASWENEPTILRLGRQQLFF